MSGNLKGRLTDHVTERIWKGRQSLNYERVTGYEKGMEEGRLRVRIHRDSYDFQCSARVERWTRQEWVEVLTRPFTREYMPNAYGVSHHDRERKSTYESALRLDAQDMLREALLIIAPY